MFKKILTILSLIAVIATAICCPVAAAEVEEPSFGYYYSADMATVYGRDITTEGELQIPASINSIAVMALMITKKLTVFSSLILLKQSVQMRLQIAWLLQKLILVAGYNTLKKMRLLIPDIITISITGMKPALYI